MSTFEVKTTVSLRYYKRKTKSEIVDRIRELENILFHNRTDLGADLSETLKKTNAQLRRLSSDRLARLAIRLHTFLPDDDQ